MLNALSTRRNRNRTYGFLAICVVLGAFSAGVGIDDNPPGLLLAYLSSISLVVAFVHPWKAPGFFVRLIFASGVGFIVSAILHNVFEGVASVVGESGIAHGPLTGAGVAFFLIAIFLCPSGFLVGVVGAAIMANRENRSSSGEPGA